MQGFDTLYETFLLKTSCRLGNIGHEIIQIPIQNNSAGVDLGIVVLSVGDDLPVVFKGLLVLLEPTKAWEGPRSRQPPKEPDDGTTHVCNTSEKPSSIDSGTVPSCGSNFGIFFKVCA
jgi:hypothetical protein